MDWELPEEEETGQHLKSIHRFSDTYNKRKLKLLGHVIRADSDDPLSQVSLKPGAATLKKVGKRKVWKPKQDWLQEGMKQTWKTFRHEIDQTGCRNPDKSGKYRDKFEQHLHIL